MQFNDFQRLPPNLREEYLKQVQSGTILNDPPAEEEIKVPAKIVPDRGFNGTAIMAIGALVVVGSFFFSAGIDGGAYESDIFNLSKGLLKLMIFLTGFLLVVVGAVIDAANRITDALTAE